MVFFFFYIFSFIFDFSNTFPLLPAFLHSLLPFTSLCHDSSILKPYPCSPLSYLHPLTPTLCPLSPLPMPCLCPKLNPFTTAPCIVLFCMLSFLPAWCLSVCLSLVLSCSYPSKLAIPKLRGENFLRGSFPDCGGPKFQTGCSL